MGKIIPPRHAEVDNTKQLSMRVPKDMLDELDRIASAEEYTRTEIVIFLLRWALQEYRHEKQHQGETTPAKANGRTKSR